MAKNIIVKLSSLRPIENRKLPIEPTIRKLETMQILEKNKPTGLVID
jgi:hypothetical protein